ncbi:MAG: hypothetical protein H0U10_01605 [Chloroflexia bacterium]|nr:hypothetical protein [Chloroflexia bacterium]
MHPSEPTRTTPSRVALATCRHRLRAAVAILSGAVVVARDAVATRDRAIAELQAADRAQDAFVVAAAHELKTPLTAIKGHGQLLRLQARGGTLGPARLDEGLAEIDRAAGILAAQLDALIAEVEAEPAAPAALAEEWPRG